MYEKLKFVMSAAWNFLLPMIRVLMTDAGTILAKAAEDAVNTVADTMGDADGEKKRQEAFKLILTALTAAGITLAKSFIYAAIEAAVVKMKSE